MHKGKFMIKIAVIGGGNGGIVTGVNLSDLGWQVICVDKDENIISQLNKGISPVYEPGLDDLLSKNLYYKRVNFTTNINKAVNDSDIIFIAVDTPQNDDGSADLSNVLDVARQIGNSMNCYKIIAGKSTIPIRAGRLVEKIIQDELDKRGFSIEFDVVS